MGQPNKSKPNSSTIALTLIAAGIILILISLIWELYQSLSAENSLTENKPAKTVWLNFIAASQEYSLDPHRASSSVAAVSVGMNSIQQGEAGKIEYRLDPMGESISFAWPASRLIRGETAGSECQYLNV